MEEFNKWWESNREKFLHAQYTEEEILYAAWKAGIESTYQKIEQRRKPECPPNIKLGTNHARKNSHHWYDKLVLLVTILIASLTLALLGRLIIYLLDKL